MEFFESDLFLTIKLACLYVILFFMVYQTFFTDALETLWRRTQHWNKKLPPLLQSNIKKSTYIFLIKGMTVVFVIVGLVVSLNILWKRWM